MMEEFASKQEKKMHAALEAHGEALVQTFLTKAKKRDNFGDFSVTMTRKRVTKIHTSS
jgi:hypothetical protein